MAVPADTAQSFKIDSKGNETVIYSFQGGRDGYSPQGVVVDKIGNIWGTTEWGGTYGLGTFFKIASDGHAVRHNFEGYPTDGAQPVGQPVLMESGDLYGITATGGNGSCSFGSNQGCGVVFAFNNSSGYEGIVHNFTGWPTDGASPAMILESKGELFGTTSIGGTTDCSNDTPGCGVVFKLTTTGEETILHSFKGSPKDGDNPTGLVLDAQGNIYGTTIEGGRFAAGNVYELTPHRKMIQLYSFRGSGQNPEGSLVRDKSGNVFGTDLSRPRSGMFGLGVWNNFQDFPKREAHSAVRFPRQRQ